MHFLETLDGTASALAAGVAPRSARQQAVQIKQRTHVRAALDAALMERFSVLKGSLTEELAAIAMHDPGDYASWTDKTMKITSSKKLTRRQRAAITSIKRSADGGVEIRLADKQQAIERLAKLTGQMREAPNADSGKFVVFVVEDPLSALRGGSSPGDNARVIDGETIDAPQPKGSHAALVIDEPTLKD